MKKSLRKTKQRIKFLDNFQKITKSISLLSAVKFQKIHILIKNIIKNVVYLISLFSEIQKRNPSIKKFLKEFVSPYKSNKSLIIVIASDRGLAGSFDKIIFEKTAQLIIDLKKQNKSIVLGIIGKKAEKYWHNKSEVVFSFSKIENVLAQQLALELIDYLDYLITYSKIDEIFIIFSKMSSAGFIIQPLKVYPFTIENLQNLAVGILPSLFKKEAAYFFDNELNRFKWNFEYILEPNVDTIARFVIKQVMFLLAYAIILESQATLEFVRTITMRRAYENSNILKNKEVIAYNKLRQQKITEELVDLNKYQLPINLI